MCHLAALMKLRAILFAIVAFAPLSLTLNAASLGEMTASAGLEWMIGKWASDDGQVAFSHTWKLDKHAVAVSFKMGDREGEGMILVKPGTDQVIYGAADNRGGMAVGKWITLNGNPTLVSTHTDAEGNERKMAIEYVKTDDETLTIKIHQVDANGEPGSNVEHEAVFKRQK